MNKWVLRLRAVVNCFLHKSHVCGFSRMNELVGLETAGLCKLFCTYVIFMWFLSRMNE